jgi:tRNA-dihydrouridine synthase A
MNLDTDKNRKIPPLQYDKVFRLKEEFPALHFNLNGGIKTIEEAESLLGNQNISGCMIGRASYDNVWMMRNADMQIFGKNNPGLSRKEIIYEYSDYCEDVINNDNTIFYDILLKPITNLFSGERKNAGYKNLLYSFKKEDDICMLPDHLKYTIEEYEKLNPFAVNEV